VDQVLGPDDVLLIAAAECLKIEIVVVAVEIAETVGRGIAALGVVAFGRCDGPMLEGFSPIVKCAEDYCFARTSYA
jgi:hypothetical protein